MISILIKNGYVVNKGTIEVKDIYIKDGFIVHIAEDLYIQADMCIDATNKYVMPGIIDDQVHFREPGLTHKATIETEARAAVAGGVTSYMEMPNVNPPSVTVELLEEKYEIAAKTSLANYSFYMGATNDNLEEVLKVSQYYKNKVCGVKVFMGSSTGNMLVDNQEALENLFKHCKMLIATHCEDEQTIKEVTSYFQMIQESYKLLTPDNYLQFSPFKPQFHHIIRNAKACLISSEKAVKLAKRYGTRLHVLHISTGSEVKLFKNNLPLEQKRITAEVCVHHLYYHALQTYQLGNKIKCNPSIKALNSQKALFKALLNDNFDVIATDHAPHTLEEKMKPYIDAPSGIPLVQHGLSMMLSFYHRKKISLEKIVEKMCHAPAVCFQIDRRGFLEPEYWADIAIVDINKRYTVSKDNILYKCGWSPLEDTVMRGVVETTIVSGHLAYHEGQFFDAKKGERLEFTR